MQAWIKSFAPWFFKLTAKYQKIVSTPEHHYIQLNSYNLLTTETTPYHTDICLLNNQEATQKNPAHACTWQYKLITPNKHTLKNHPAYTYPTSMNHQKNPVHADTRHYIYTQKEFSPSPVPARESEEGENPWRRRRPTLPHCGAVPSARAGLTSLFGMGRGGTPQQ